MNHANANIPSVCYSQTSTRILVSSAGTITDSYSSKAFGEPLQNGSGTTNPYRYDGQVLYYYELNDVINAWNRWPRPSTGQWRSADPIGFDGRLRTFYGYVGNEPLGLSDPLGLLPKFVGCRDTDIAKLTTLFTRMCGPLMQPDNPGWPAAQKCARDCDACPVPYNAHDNTSTQHKAVISDCMKSCYKGFCDTWGIVKCVYGDCTKACNADSAACVPNQDRGSCSRFQPGHPGPINPDLQTIRICMDRAFPAGGPWDKTHYTCTGGPYLKPYKYYPDCKQGCEGFEDVFYMLHELQHICGDVNDPGTNECAANQQACCLINGLYIVPGK